MRDLGKTIARAERHRDNKEYYSAEMEFNNALKVDEENVRANFGLGLTYLERNEVDKAENIFNRLVRLEATFEPEHKHLFNEFGIQLRKNKMYKESMEYYQRALELSNTDENIYYNMARVALESKDPAQAVSALLKCLEMNPGMEEGLLFLSWMKDKNMVPAGSAKEVEQTLKKARIVQSGAREPAAQPQGPREQPPDADKPA
jgi:tetratricopeptide (TPR) repeat protein